VEPLFFLFFIFLGGSKHSSRLDNETACCCMGRDPRC